ncbi:unnamed protein product [Sympodiomycopsis kandeliae]
MNTSLRITTLLQLFLLLLGFTTPLTHATVHGTYFYDIKCGEHPLKNELTKTEWIFGGGVKAVRANQGHIFRNQDCTGDKFPTKDNSCTSYDDNHDIGCWKL